MTEPSSTPPRGRDGLAVVSIVLAAFAVLGAAIAVGLAVGASASDEPEVTPDTSGTTVVATTTAPAGGTTTMPAGGATVSMTEFAVTPATAEVGGSIHVMNDGEVLHNLAVDGTELITPDLDPGDMADLELTDLDAGTYTIFCAVPGHREAGMEAELTVLGEGEAPPDGGGAGDDMDFAAMTAAMLETFAEFPQETEGVGNQVLEPTEVLDDGTKVFDLTMQLGDWEVSAGDVVEAWTFNGMVPAPMLQLEVGDSVQVRVLNELPIATDVHWHGINVTNANDGVAPITQPLIEPGETFTYEFTTDEQAVAMYHPHAHGHMLLPNGMFGPILVGQVRLPVGETIGLEEIPADLEISQEIPMVLNDAGVIGYSLNGKSFPATQPYGGAVGDWVLIHYFNEGNQIHPMHLHQFDQIVVAKDGYPLDEPYTVDTLNVAPGERYSVLVNLDEPGTWVWHCHILPHVEREAGMFGMVTAFVVS